MTLNTIESIPEFYTNKTILITGGSGFLGKVLIEKLLRSCPDIKKIYLLMRAKKGKSPEDRIRALTDIALFDPVRQQNPTIFKKLAVVTGNCSELNLGLNQTDRQKLIEETNIIFHGAASVRFDDPLDIAVLLNTRGTREMCLLAKEMKNLKVFVHISTTYCNCDKKEVEEKLYPAHMDWQKAIDIAENIDRKIVNVMTKKFIDPLPNTYTFAKSLSEHVVYDLCKEAKIPLVIFRPSIVVSTLEDPFPGWIDSFNGVMGIFAGCASGTVLTFYAPPTTVTDNIPADYVIKGLINSAWKKITDNNPNELTVYNGSNNGRFTVEIQDIYKFGEKHIEQYPLDHTVLTPTGAATNCFYYFYLQTVIYQLVPALIIDFFMRLTDRKPFLLNVQRRIFVANIVLHYFIKNSWKFPNQKFLLLGNKALLEQDINEFGFEENLDIDMSDFFLKAMLGIRRYLFKQKDEDLPKARLHAIRLRYFTRTARYIFYLLTLWIFYKIVISYFPINFME